MVIWSGGCRAPAAGSWVDDPARDGEQEQPAALQPAASGG